MIWYKQYFGKHLNGEYVQNRRILSHFIRYNPLLREEDSINKNLVSNIFSKNYLNVSILVCPVRRISRGKNLRQLKRALVLNI